MEELPQPNADRLDDYRFQFGHDAGNLAAVVDRLTDALRLVAEHTVYCRVEKGPRASAPPLDIKALVQILESAKSLVKDSFQRLKP